MEIVSGQVLNGAVQHSLLLMHELARRGHELTLVCRPNSWLERELRGSPSIAVVHSDLRRWPWDELRRIADEARRRRIDILHSHMSRAHFFGVLLRRFAAIPCVATAQCRHIQAHWMFNDFVIAASEATRRFHRRFNLVPARRLQTIPNFVDVSDHGSDDARRSLRASLGVAANATLVGVVGAVSRRKGQLDLIRALPQVLAAAPHTTIALVGPQLNRDYQRQCRELAAELHVADRIIWTGQRSDIPDVLRALDVFVLPSHEETLPLAVLEAMAAGTPVVATDVGGVAECLEHEQHGLLIPPARPDALAESLVRMLAAPEQARAWANAARQRVREEYSPGVNVDRVEQLFQRLVESRASRASRTRGGLPATLECGN